MAREVVTRKICDRCKKPTQENTGAEDESKSTPLVYVEASGPLERDTIEFEDLCDKCQGRVGDLLAQIAREPTKKKASKKDAGEAPRGTEEGDTKDDSGEEGDYTRDPGQAQAVDPSLDGNPNENHDSF